MIRLAKPLLDGEEMAEIGSVLASGFLSRGPKVAEFEEALAGYLGVRHAVSVSSGTAALHLSVLALGLSEGDEVIVPDFSFPATANAVALAGAKPVLCDVHSATFNIDAGEVERLITPRTKAVMPVHQFGLPADMNAIVKIAKDCELNIIEDAACALGAEHQSQKCGTLGKIACFSFHPRKIATTGEGGVVVTDDDVIAEKVRSLRNHGSLKGDFVLAGYNYRMSDINAALGVAQLRKLPMLIERRRELARLYGECLRGVAGLSLPQDFEGARHTYQSYVVSLDAQLDRDKAILELKERGVEAGIGTYAIHQLRYYKGKWDSEQNRLSRSATAYHQALSLPLYAQMSEDDVRYVCRALRTTLPLGCEPE